MLCLFIRRTKTSPPVFHPPVLPKTIFILIPLICQNLITCYLPITLKKSKLRISVRGTLLCKNFLTNSEKSLKTMSLFKSKVKNKLLVLEKEAKYFQ